MSNEAKIDYYYSTPIWLFDKPEWLKSINKVCDEYIKEAYTRDLKEKKVKKIKILDGLIIQDHYLMI